MKLANAQQQGALVSAERWKLSDEVTMAAIEVDMLKHTGAKVANELATTQQQREELTAEVEQLKKVRKGKESGRPGCRGCFPVGCGILCALPCSKDARVPFVSSSV